MVSWVLECDVCAYNYVITCGNSTEAGTPPKYQCISFISLGQFFGPSRLTLLFSAHRSAVDQ